MREQFIHIDEYGHKHYYSDRKMRIFHREDGPAIECANGGTEWYINGKRHREDGPAIEYTNGSKSWYINDKLHREDGPAIVYADGYKSWYINGKLHREDGPAIDDVDGYKAWYLNDKHLTEEEFNTRMNPVTELTLQEYLDCREVWSER
jgi:hypothetical protein